MLSQQDEAAHDITVALLLQFFGVKKVNRRSASVVSSKALVPAIMAVTFTKSGPGGGRHTGHTYELKAARRCSFTTAISFS